MLRIFGVPRIESVDGVREVSGHIAATVFSVLVARPNRPVGVSELTDAVWGDAPPPTAASSLRSHVTRLRRALVSSGEAAEIIAQRIAGRSAYLLVVDDGAVDHLRFERALTAARDAARHAPDRARSLLDEALWLSSGTPFDGVDVMDLLPVTRRLEEMRLDAHELRGELDLAAGEHARSATELHELARSHPEREMLCHTAMLALSRSGRQQEALALFQHIRGWLDEHLGIEPTTALVQLERDILLHAPGVDAPEPAHAAARLPRSLSIRRRGRYVRTPLTDLVVDTVIDPEASGLICTGSAGVGKSRMLAEAAAALVERGVIVGYGWSLGEHDPPFGALTRAMRSLRESGVDGGALDVAITSLDAAAAISDVRARSSHVIRAIDAFADGATSGGAVCLLLDDVHWADGSTVFAVRHLMHRAASDLSVIAVGRPTSTASSSAWVDLCAEATSLPSVRVRRLEPMSVDDVLSLVNSAPDRIPGPIDRIARYVHGRTGGIAYFVLATIRELANAAADDPAWTWSRLRPDPVPTELSEVVRARIDRLSDDVVQTLQIAAVVGNEFDSHHVAAVATTVFGTAGRPLSEHECGGAIVPAADRGAFAFEHDLVRAALLESIDDRTRRRFHAAAAVVAERDGLPASVIASHLLEGVPEVDVRVAVAAALTAGDHAYQGGSLDEAADLFRRGLAVLDRYGLDDPDLEIDLRVGRALASQRLGSRGLVLPELVATFDRADDLDRPRKMADVALAAAAAGDVLQVEDPVRSMLERCLERSIDDRRRLHALVAEATIKRVIVDGATDDLIRRHSETFADASSSAALLLRDRSALHLAAGAPQATWRLGLARSLLERTDDRRDVIWQDAKLFELAALMELGRTDEALQSLETYESVATAYQLPASVWLAKVARADLAQQRGDFAAANDLSGDAVEYGVAYQIPDATESFHGHRFVTAFLTTGTGDLADLFGDVATGRGARPPVAAAHALALAQAGRITEAVDVASSTLDRLVGGPAWTLRPIALAALSFAVAEIGDPTLAARLIPEVAPYSGTLPRMALVGASYGPADGYLAGLLEVAGRRVDAAESLERAAALARRAEADAWIERYSGGS